MSWQAAAALVVFAGSYLLIAFPAFPGLPIGRAGVALVGATLMVVVGALTPAQSYAAISGDTIALLLGMMIISAYLERAGFFASLAGRASRLSMSPRRTLVWLSVAAAALSALLVNDTVCLVFTPVVVGLCRRARLPMGPYLIALATSANLGSAATLVGNPQNMLVGSMSGMHFAAFLGRTGPVVLVALLAHVGLLLAYYGRRVDQPVEHPAGPDVRPPEAHDLRHGVGLRTAAVVFAGVVVALFLGAHMGTAALAGAGLLVVLDRRDARAVITAVDWPLLVFFAGLFIIVEGLRATGLVAQAFEALAPGFALDSAAGVGRFTAALTAGSNLVSNVPMVVLTGPELPRLGGAELGWLLTAYVTTVAGNLTLVGSVANLIVAEGAREHYTLGFREYWRFGAVATAVSLAVGVPLLVLGG